MRPLASPRALTAMPRPIVAEATSLTRCMFHDMLCFTICLFSCPNENLMYVYVWDPICFTICLFITGSPDLDGYRAPQKALTLQDPQGLETQIRSHRVMFSPKYRLP